MTINFRKLLPAGWTPPPKPKTSTIKGLRTDCFTGIEIEVDVEAMAGESSDGPTFKLLNGPTGYESMYAYHLKKAIKAGGWLACMGTKGRWDRLFIHASELRKAQKELGL